MSSLFQILAHETLGTTLRSSSAADWRADANVSRAARRSCGLPAALARNSIWRASGI